jgi:hypothetical protein
MDTPAVQGNSRLLRELFETDSDSEQNAVSLQNGTYNYQCSLTL